MASWPTGWREHVLRACGIPKTQFALDVLDKWQRSTPLEPYSNNPLGMPAQNRSDPRWMNTAYAAFPTMQAFYAAFKHHLAIRDGRGILHVLISADDLAAIWREIHALGWPGSITETDYPHMILDAVEQKYRNKLTSRKVGTTKGTGVVAASPSTHDAVRKQASALFNVAQVFDDTSDAIGYLIRNLD